MTHDHDGMITNVGKLPRPAINPPQPKQSLWARLGARFAGAVDRSTQHKGTSK